MRNVVLGISAAALALSLAACGGTDQLENNIATEDLNATTNSEELPPVAPAANVAVDTTVTETSQSEPVATKPAPAKPAPAKPKPTPAKPKPAPAELKVEPAAEPKAPDATCTPEHRAMGHC